MRPKLKYRGALLGRVKHDLPKLTGLKVPKFRPKKLVFAVNRKLPFKVKGSYSETFLNSWKKNHLLTKETVSFYGLKRARQTLHRLRILKKSKRSLFSQSESMLGVLVVRCGWASDLKKAHGILNKSKVKVNGKVVKSFSLVIAVGSTIEACFSVKRQGSVDFSFLPHLISVHTHKAYLVKEPKFCPELVFYDLKRGLSRLC